MRGGRDAAGFAAGSTRCSLVRGALLFLIQLAASSRVHQDSDGAICFEEPPTTVAVFSQKRVSCADFCEAALPHGSWSCGGAHDVMQSCGEALRSQFRALDCSKQWATKVCKCVARQESEAASGRAIKTNDDGTAASDSPALSSMVEVWESVLPRALLALAVDKHRALMRLNKQVGSTGRKRGREDRSLSWIDVAAEPDSIGARPRDYVEAIVSSVVAASPRLRELHASGG
eukprot:CAMPEP_0119391954 /NCGR_PEP_ID=MMETSP1334-20130426/119292_1 /TAXON_ID=127549 /ORGANISM="Calcidiscus leptoporus, Strain RCC1130" /LENGTH=230 /DNA_ID=CAMNT_0007414731 /DNA_START=52 /DNA_END=741 /DNA_ORIENTATION=+